MSDDPAINSPFSDTAPGEDILALTAEAVKHAVSAGQLAPTFRLQDLHGGIAALIDLIQQRPLVISFYRGVWCDFCNAALGALSRFDTDIQALGATHVAIGPDPAGADQTQRIEAFPMPVLVDHGLRVTTSYGLTISLPDHLRESYCKVGYAPLTEFDSGDWLVPVPATYLVDRTGRVAMAAIDINYRNRLHPEDLLSALRSLNRRGLA